MIKILTSTGKNGTFKGKVVMNITDENIEVLGYDNINESASPYIVHDRELITQTIFLKGAIQTTEQTIDEIRTRVESVILKKLRIASGEDLLHKLDIAKVEQVFTKSGYTS